MKHKIFTSLFLLSQLGAPLVGEEVLHFDTTPPESEEKSLTVNFQDVSMLEFLRFVSTVAERNFIYDEKILDFNISLVTGKATDPKNILKIMVELLEKQGNSYREARRLLPCREDGRVGTGRTERIETCENARPEGREGRISFGQ